MRVCGLPVTVSLVVGWRAAVVLLEFCLVSWFDIYRAHELGTRSIILYIYQIVEIWWKALVRNMVGRRIDS